MDCGWYATGGGHPNLRFDLHAIVFRKGEIFIFGLCRVRGVYTRENDADKSTRTRDSTRKEPLTPPLSLLRSSLPPTLGSYIHFSVHPSPALLHSLASVDFLLLPDVGSWSNPTPSTPSSFQPLPEGLVPGVKEKGDATGAMRK